MDIYFLSRVFKRFDNPTLSQPEEARNCMVFAGDLHITVYTNLLEEMGFDLIEEGKSLGSQCVDISTMRWPFFQEVWS